MKLRAYKRTYPIPSCPMEKFDYFADNIIIYDKKYKKVLSSFNIITKEMCRDYSIDFPLFDNVRSRLKKEEIELLRNWYDKTTSIGLNYGWAIADDTPKDVKEFIKNMALSCLMFYYQEFNIKNIIDINVIKLNIHKLKEGLGYKYIKNIPPLHIYETKCHIMYKDDPHFPVAFKERSGLYKSLWKKKDIIEGKTIDLPKELASQ